MNSTFPRATRFLRNNSVVSTVSRGSTRDEAGILIGIDQTRLAVQASFKRE